MDNACYAERRAFLKALTTTTAAAWAVGACGGAVSGLGGTTSTPPAAPGSPPGSSPTPPGNGSPVWQTVPTITFTQGFASFISVAGFVTDPNGDALTIALNSTALPAGITFDAANKRFVYDGVGAVASTSNNVLTANDGKP